MAAPSSCCAYCSAEDPSFSCGRCGTKYKSRECQVADWPQHRKLCASLATARSGDDADQSPKGLGLQPSEALEEREEAEVSRCAYCQSGDPSFSCARCGTKYKSRECQVADWPQHKNVCAALAEKKIVGDSGASNRAGKGEEEGEDEEEEVKYCCSYCQGKNPSFACGRCGTKYLSEQCQVADWSQHRKICASLSLLKAERSAAKARLRSGAGTLNDRLYNACLLGRLADASKLIADGGDVDAFNSAGSTCLIAGAIGRQPRLVDMLLRKNGASVDQPSKAGITALMVAAQGGCSSVVEVLLASHADAQLRTADGNSALDFAAACDHDAVVSMLVSPTSPGPGLATVPVPVNGCDHQGVSALGKACARGSLAAVQVLLQAGADPLLRALDGNTPLSAARHFGHAECVALLEARVVEMGGATGAGPA